jgi:hypothetical protein
MTEYTDNYKNLIIKQYWNKTKSVAEIELKAGAFERIYSLMRSFETELDIDVATGDRLDKIGKIVGISREDLYPYFGSFFGFDDNPSSLPMGDKFLGGGGQFFDKFYTGTISGVLDDDEYRFYIKAKISVNSASGYMVSDEFISIQSVIQYLFDGYAIVLDNMDMSLTLEIEDSVQVGRVYLARDLNLLPRPQGVEYNTINLAGYDYFGWSDDPNALGFGDSSDVSIGGIFAETI